MSSAGLPAPLTAALETLPGELRSQVDYALERHPHALDLPEAVLESLPRVWACSEFVTDACRGADDLLADLAGRDLLAVYPDGEYHRRLEELLAPCIEGDEAQLHRALRRFRRREMLRIAWRDLAGWADLEQTLAELSALAEACIDRTLAVLHQRLCGHWGTPRNAAGEPQQLVVLGMGKLGGQELNFSSDIDLIFAFPEAGETDGRRPRANEEFFTRLGRALIAALDQQTADGLVFRVDMRLRPYGNAGPLAPTFAATERYYQEQGREWERYAMIKARVVGGDYDRGAELLETLRPFVYRRYLDYGVLEALREMKAMVVREVQRKGLEQNIKLGPGGIREVEFVAQVFQLIRGGQDPSLRSRRLLPVLEHLGAQELLPGFVQRDLVEGYRFLRRAENRLQAMGDRQTHDLPREPLDRLRLASAMGFEAWEPFNERLSHWRRKIHDHFQQVFEAPQKGDAPGEPEQTDAAEIWAGSVDPEEAARWLAEEGFQESAAARDLLRQFREGSHCRALSARGRQRLDRLMPMVIRAVAGSHGPDRTLERVLKLLDAIVRRTAYLALLNEHPMALSQLVQLCAASPWISRYLARHPVLLDELLDPRSLYAPLGRDDLSEELEQRLARVEAEDLEQQMEVLRHFRHTHTLRVAAADISGAMPLMVVSDYLTDVAEVIVGAVLRIAREHLLGRHGRPRCDADGEQREPGFVVLAYGKLGGIEFGYGSDLDLVFVHGGCGRELGTDGPRPLENSVYFARLAQRIIHILGTATPGGVLYEVDVRLRPSGKAGLLSTSLEAFADYQRNRAWTWEHQALVRARVVAGDAALAEQVEAVRSEVLCRARDAAELAGEVRNMRSRVLREKGHGDAAAFDLKIDAGGMADIEFLVQYGVLAGAHEHPELTRFTDNIRLLDALSGVGWLAREQARALADAYRVYRSRAHQLTLQEEPARVPAEELAAHREAVSRIWDQCMEAAARAADEEA